MLKIQSLASGSRGNAAYISSDTTQILVDVGLSVRELSRRMREANINPEEIDAIVITHEHSDHVCGLENFLDRFDCKLYIHEDVSDILLFKNLSSDKINYFTSKFSVGDIVIDFFPVPHDSQFCFGYSFTQGDAKISLTTDLGRVTPQILRAISGSQVVLLECNHDTQKLSSNTKYPMHLKRRISGSNGHLSNVASALAIYELVQMGVQQVILAHLSEQNNSPTLAYNCVCDYLAKQGVQEGVDISIDIATQNAISTVFQID